MKVSSWLMKADVVNLVNERSICGPPGLCWICRQRCQSRCDHTAALCSFTDVFVGNKLEIVVAGRLTTTL